MYVSPVPFWKASPFVRLLLPFAAGITCEYYLHPGITAGWIILILSFTAIFLFSRAALHVRFSGIQVYGYALHCLIAACGILITSYQDLADEVKGIEKLERKKTLVAVSILQPLSEKPATWKGIGQILFIQNEDTLIYSSAKILLYFRKHPELVPPAYGDRIAFVAPMQRITNAGIPGHFDYRRYCALQDIYFRVFLKKGEVVVLPGKKTTALNSFLFDIQHWVVNTLKKYIPGDKECGLAEALLIGYKDDLNKPLIEAYSNTGVVHVVAISGLHLGLIYVLLKYVCIPLYKRSGGKWISMVLILGGLWIFALLCGGSPSVLRSAVMFSFMVCGECISRRSPVINNLAASAFFLLCYQPYWLWDIGFQLSYTALLSIIVFQKPVYGWLVLKHRILDAVWKLNAVTLAAQVLTLPVCIYHFRQFPVLFLPANCVAVPLSSVILVGEIGLCGLSFSDSVAHPLGVLLSWLIRIMNNAVEWLDHIGFASIGGLEISLLQLIVFYLFICFTSSWLMSADKRMLPLALIAAILFMVLKLI